MDRRKLVVGGGATALAATLAALPGGGIPAAAASTMDAEPTSTAAHARLVLDHVNVDLGLVNPAGFQSRFGTSYAAYQASFAQGDPELPPTNDLDAWVRQRMVDLSGTDSYAVAVTEAPQTRTLLAFSFLAYTQHQDTPLPQIEPRMPVPAVLETLEPDFFPVLLGQIDDKRNTSSAFADALQASSAELDRIIAETPLQESPGDGGPDQSASRVSDGLNLAAGVLVLLLVVRWASGRGK